MKIIGLTGLTGAGKSTVAQKLMAYGCYHIDADKVAKNVINNSKDVKNKLKERFGDDVVNKIYSSPKTPYSILPIPKLL